MKMKKNLFRRFLVISQFLLLVSLCISPVKAAGEVDPTFTPALIKTQTARTAMTAIQSDGKIIAYGIFTAASGMPVGTNVVRLNTDGTLDTSFNAPGINGVANVTEIALQSNGKIIIGGFLGIGNQPPVGILRLNTDGTLDATFPTNVVGAPVQDVEILPDDRILVARFNGIFRLNADGALDQTFTTVNLNIGEITAQPDGKIVAATTGTDGNTLRRYNADGTTDAGFTVATFNSTVWDIRLQADGKILIGGHFTLLNGFTRKKIARLNADGSGDTSFNAAFGDGGFIIKMIPLPDGRILVGGKDLSNTAHAASISFWRLNTDGSADTSFMQSISFQTYDLDRLADGKIIMSGEAPSTFVLSRAMYRLSADGAVDSTFQGNFGVNGEGRKVFVQPDGKILVCGNFNFANNTAVPSVARFNADGTVDPSFNPTFPYNSTDIFTAIDVQPDGKIIIGSIFDALRLNPNGSSDIVFAGTGSANDIKVLGDGKILIAGANYIKRFNSNGTLDGTFATTIGGSFPAAVQKIAIQPDGKIIIVGSFTFVNSGARERIARLNTDGTSDNTFDTSTGANGPISDVAIQSNGQVLIGGSFSGYDLTNRPFLARLNTNGSLDIGFLPNINAPVESLKIQPNNKILIGGLFNTVNTVSRPLIARINPDGNLDVSFNPGSGANRPIFDVEYQPNGKILIAGQYSLYNGAPKSGIARLQNSFVNTTLFDYDGDAKADVSVYRPSTNRWYVFKSSDSTVSETTFGIAGDVPVPADFDGDGKTDIAIFRPSSGDWWSLSSINSAQIFAHWGANGDIPRPSDFDGDGRADYIVFRPSDNFWYRISSGNGASSNGAFGLAGDKPVTGDFDGDGKSDKAIFRPSTGDWWYQSSINGAQLAVHWGISTDIPAPADFDGDGKTDFAVYRPSTGVWYIINSSNFSFTIMNFGIAEDKPVPADYDGDGKADIAVFRPSTGTWYQMKTTAGFSAQQFGISTDIPTENAFVP
jgi:uncharacterized delta-60 repeat protein